MKHIILHEFLKQMLSKASVGLMADNTRFPSYYCIVELNTSDGGSRGTT